MHLDTSKYIWAFFLAPLTAGLGLSLSMSNCNMFKSLSGAVVFIPITYPFALLGMLILGLPSFLLLKHFKILNVFTLSIIGLPLGYLSAVITGDLNDPLWLKNVCIVGPVVSTTAALIILKKTNNLKSGNV